MTCAECRRIYHAETHWCWVCGQAIPGGANGVNEHYDIGGSCAGKQFTAEGPGTEPNNPVRIAERTPGVNIILSFHSWVVLLLMVPVILLNIPFIILGLGIIFPAYIFLVEDEPPSGCAILPMYIDLPLIGNEKTAEIIIIVFFAPVWTVSIAIVAAWIGLGMLISVVVVIVGAVFVVPYLLGAACVYPAATVVTVTLGFAETATLLILSPFLGMLKAHRDFCVTLGRENFVQINSQEDPDWKWYPFQLLVASALSIVALVITVPMCLLVLVFFLTVGGGCLWFVFFVPVLSTFVAGLVCFGSCLCGLSSVVYSLVVPPVYITGRCCGLYHDESCWVHTTFFDYVCNFFGYCARCFFGS